MPHDLLAAYAAQSAFGEVEKEKRGGETVACGLS